MAGFSLHWHVACGYSRNLRLTMNDLPLFLQMFVRMFAALALGVSVYLFVDRPSEESAEACKDHAAATSQAAKQTDEHGATNSHDASAAKKVEQPKS